MCVCVCVCVCVRGSCFIRGLSVCNVVMFLRPVSASFRCVFNISGLSQHPRLRSVRLTTRLLHDPLPVFNPSVQVDVKTEGLSKHTHLWSWPLESLCTQQEVSAQHLKMTKPSTLSRLSVSHHASCSGKKECSHKMLQKPFQSVLPDWASFDRLGPENNALGG